MSDTPYTAPEFGLNVFSCPQCRAHADQKWHAILSCNLGVNNIDSRQHQENVRNALSSQKANVGSPIHGWSASFCAHCRRFSIFHDEKLIFPRLFTTPPPHVDIPEKIKSEYEEARAILNDSPRGAAAMLRLAVQKLCDYLEQKPVNLNECIGKWVKAGLDKRVQEALDSVRVIGNHAVHPGTIDLNDNREIAVSLFEVFNFIIEKKISDEKRMAELYEKVIPEDEKRKISKRDES